MLENRSFDHYLGWLATDEQYLDAGRSRYGRTFAVTGRQDLRYENKEGRRVATAHLPSSPNEPNPYRGCEHPVPGHGWNTGRAQRDHGFLAEGTGNDEYALGYYAAADIAVHANLARRFTVSDHHYSSLLGDTFINRQYMHAATSEGRKDPPKQLDVGVYKGDTIWDRLAKANVSARYYYTDLPFLALYGDRFADRITSVDEYFDDAQQGKLANVVMVDPGFGGAARSDNHPHGDIRMAQRFLHSVFSAFAQSPQWERGLFVVTYDEWGGFFDHVTPPVFADDRESSDDEENFGQAGFRVPTILASPYVRRGFVDRAPYEHTSILRFLEWRFLGAPASGADAKTRWYLTKRDRNAQNIGASLVTTADPELDFDLETPLPVVSDDCTAAPPPAAERGPSDVPHTAALDELIGTAFPPATGRPWETA
jgi:phospholipase C